MDTKRKRKKPFDADKPSSKKAKVKDDAKEIDVAKLEHPVLLPSDASGEVSWQPPSDVRLEGSCAKFTWKTPFQNANALKPNAVVELQFKRLGVDLLWQSRNVFQVRMHSIQ